jgi:hypothetical protein
MARPCGHAARQQARRSRAARAVGITRTEKETPRESLGDARGVRNKPGNDLLSHTRARAVPSALEGLTSEFEMGSGMAPPTSSPENFVFPPGTRSIAAYVLGHCLRHSGTMSQSRPAGALALEHVRGGNTDDCHQWKRNAIGVVDAGD